ncbi:MAG: antitoxin family protein [Archaeoglobi archaeon]|nr:antitoxin family protein [Candidatus Mnemosynella bozhongmuii]
MGKIIEAVYEKGVFRPLQKVDLREGERVRIEIKVRRLEFEPIELRRVLKIEDINSVRDELWTSS